VEECLVVGLEGKIPFRRNRQRLEDIKMDVIKTGLESCLK
jgi:hypothetical protein